MIADSGGKSSALPDIGNASMAGNCRQSTSASFINLREVLFANVDLVLEAAVSLSLLCELAFKQFWVVAFIRLSFKVVTHVFVFTC